MFKRKKKPAYVLYDSTNKKRNKYRNDNKETVRKGFVYIDEIAYALLKRRIVINFYERNTNRRTKQFENDGNRCGDGYTKGVKDIEK